jgi:hypothetical protein
MKTKSFQNIISRFWSIAMLGLLPNLSSASEPLSLAAAGIAESVQAHLVEESLSGIKIGKFVPASESEIDAYGTRIAIALQKELELFKVKVDPNAKQIIEGRYSIDKESKAIKVNAQISKVTGKRVQAFPFELVSASEKEPDSQKTLSESAAKDSLDAAIENEVTELLPQTIKDPGELLFVSGKTSVLPENESLDSILAATNILDESTEKFCIQDGFLVLERMGVGIRLHEIHPDQERDSPNFYGRVVLPSSIEAPHFYLRKNAHYSIELKNYRDNIDLATKVLFDGIDTTVFSEAEADREKLLWLVPSKKSVAVYGWFRNTESSDAFQMVTDERSVAHQFGVHSNRGTIQLNVFAAWDPSRDKEIPAVFKRVGTRTAAGQGSVIKNSVQRVKVKTGVLLGQLMVEYAEEAPLAAR